MKLREHLDKIYDALTDLRVVSAKQQQLLDEHIRRTEIAEEGIILLQDTMRRQDLSLTQLDGYVARQRKSLYSVKKALLTVLAGVLLATITHFLFH